MADEKQEGDFRIGGVLKQTCSVFAGNFLKFTAIAVTSVVPTLTFPARDGYAPVDLGLSMRAAGVICLASFLLGESIMFVSAIQVLQGRSIRLSDSFKLGLRRFPSLAGIGLFIFLILIFVFATFLFILATLQGLSDTSSAADNPSAALALSLAFVTLLTVFSVAMPICVIEGLGPLRSLRRGVTLTKGHRWKVLLLVFLVIVIGAGFMAMMRILMSTLLASSPPEIVGRVSRINAIWVALWLAFFAVALATSYHELRAAEGGNKRDQIAAVFQ
jgi:hypothetical protein